jgi:hypothetical protein
MRITNPGCGCNWANISDSFFAGVSSPDFNKSSDEHVRLVSKSRGALFGCAPQISNSTPMKPTFTSRATPPAVPVAGVVFAGAAREYPIAFIRGNDKQIRPVELLGVRDGENMFVDGQGKRDARTISRHSCAAIRPSPQQAARQGRRGGEKNFRDQSHAGEPITLHTKFLIKQ